MNTPLLLPTADPFAKRNHEIGVLRQWCALARRTGPSLLLPLRSVESPQRTRGLRTQSFPRSRVTVALPCQQGWKLGRPHIRHTFQPALASVRMVLFGHGGSFWTGLGDAGRTRGAGRREWVVHGEYADGALAARGPLVASADDTVGSTHVWDCPVVGWSLRNQRRFMMNHTDGWMGGWAGGGMWFWTVIAVVVVVVPLVVVISKVSKK